MKLSCRADRPRFLAIASTWLTAGVPHGHNPGHITHEIMINIANLNYYWGADQYAVNATASVPAQSSSLGFMGVALRNADTETFVLSRSRIGASGHTWQELIFTAAQLAALDQNAVYTLDLIDERRG